MTPETLAWFEAAVGAPTAVQRGGWAAIDRGENALLIAPTGSGKTLAAFLSGVDRLINLDPAAPPAVRLLYVSPLKALVVDIERNLSGPLAALKARAAAEGRPFRDVRVDVRTGDTPAAARARQRRSPADILVTTPESLYLLLTSGARETLRGIEAVIVDEVHALAGTKRGVHLCISLERLAARALQDPQRIGLSATCRPPEPVASWLGGDRAVTIIDTSEPPRIDLEIAPVEQPDQPLLRPPPSTPAVVGAHVFPREDQSTDMGLWAAVVPKLLEIIAAHQTTLVFTNSRQLCERLTHRINEVSGEVLARAHHGSLDHARRAEVEGALKAGTLRCLVATSSLELGIDIGAIDFVVMIASPQAASRGLQRLGRAGHQVGARSAGLIFPKYPGDLLEAAVVGAAMLRGDVEPIHQPTNCLDVLAQQVAAMVSLEPWLAEEVLALVRRAAPYRTLSRSLLDAVLDQLSGRFPSDRLADLDARIVWDRASDQLRARASTRRIVVLNGGTIPDKGLYRVQMVGDGARLGELDEEMVFEVRRGDVLVLGSSSWRVELIEQDRVIVSPAPGMPGRLPFWKGDSPGRPAGIGAGIGALLRGVESTPKPERVAWLCANYPLQKGAAVDLVAWIEAQDLAAAVPTDRRVVVERFRDDLGDWQVCLHCPLGSTVTAAWALWLEQRLSQRAGFDVRATWTDDGVVVRFASGDHLPAVSELFPTSVALRDQILLALGHTGLFAARFRENAGRALLLPKHRPGRRSPLWRQRKRSGDLLATVRQHPDFPVVLETVRECLEDEFDLDTAGALFDAVARGDVDVVEVESRFPSPFSRDLLQRQTAEQLYETDASPAERRAQLLGLDPRLLHELLGETPIAQLLSAEVIHEHERDLQGLRHPPRDADGLHDLLRRLGPMRPEVVRERFAEAEAWIIQLESGHQAWLASARGATWLVAAEDAALARDALGVSVPSWIPASLRAPARAPLRALVARFAARRGPFHLAEAAASWALPEGPVREAADELVAQGALIRGVLHPSDPTERWCDLTVLRDLQSRALAAARRAVEPEDDAAFQRFLLRWHSVGGRSGVEAALDHLAGAAVPFADLVDAVLPARLSGFDGRHLDELGASGEWVWVGAGAVPGGPPRVRVVRRELSWTVVEAPALRADPAERHILEVLGRAGSAFFTELMGPALRSLQPTPTVDEVEAALWRLAADGLVSTDTFAPLRAIRGPRRSGARTTSGRWWPTTQLLSAAPSVTERRIAQVEQLFSRAGIVSRESAAEVEGGFSGLWPVLKEMEARGVARRGWFVRSLAGAQFASPAAADRVRAARDAGADPALLATTDPALAWGGLIPWPGGLGPRRVPGARVVLIEGEPCFGWEGKRAFTFGGPAAATARAVEIVRVRLDYERLLIRSLDGVAIGDVPQDALGAIGLRWDGAEAFVGR